MPFIIIPLTEEEYPWASQLLAKRWGSPEIVTRGTIHKLKDLRGFVAKHEEKLVGLITYRINDNQCEIVSLDSLIETQGVGTALIEAVKHDAKSQGFPRVWTITTNDNLEAIRFWKNRGFTINAIHHNAIEESRKLKPQIPLIGMHGIPIRDEIELELLL